jgi:3-dehydroquinate synthase
MAAAARLAVLMDLCKPEVEHIQNKLLAELKLPTRLPENSSVNDIIQAMHSDKKNSSNAVTMVLPTAIGAVKIVKNIDEQLLRQALEDLL